MGDPQEITWEQIDDALAVLGLHDRRAFMRLEIVGRLQVECTRMVHDEAGAAILDDGMLRIETLIIPVVRGPARRVAGSRGAPPSGGPASWLLWIVTVALASSIVFFAGWVAARLTAGA